MNRLIFILSGIMFLNITLVQAQQSANSIDYLKNESAPGARASMGIFAAGYGKALAEELFDFKLNSWQNRVSSIGMAALGYQLLSYNTDEGFEFKPLEFKKEWKGYWEGYLVGESLDLSLAFIEKYDAAKFTVASTVVIAMAIVFSKSKSSGGWRTADDGPLTIKNLFTNRHSYWVHFAGSGGLYWAFSNHTSSQELALLYTSSLIWLWEVKDGYLRWEDHGFIGGDGFSWRDGVAGSVAAVGSYVIDKWIFSFIKSNIFNYEISHVNKTELAFYPDFFQKRILIEATMRF